MSGKEEMSKGEPSEKMKPNYKETLEEIAQYFRESMDEKGEPSGAVITDNNQPTFYPSWEDIFRMNQQELQAAVRQVSKDTKLEPSRKAYLIQNIMASKYVVAQQNNNNSNSSLKLHLNPKNQELNGCTHYKRNCAIVAPCCQKVFNCRFCHDQASDHEINRYEIKEMVCLNCMKKQKISNKCENCGKQMAQYYCNICHLFDDDKEKKIYHCQFCNICRRGEGLGIDFFHCMECNACMHMNLYKRHKCREKCMEQDCPVCKCSLFYSCQEIRELPCGHFLHASCFKSIFILHLNCVIKILNYVI